MRLDSSYYCSKPPIKRVFSLQEKKLGEIRIRKEELEYKQNTETFLEMQDMMEFICFQIPKFISLTVAFNVNPEWDKLNIPCISDSTEKSLFLPQEALCA